MLVINIHFIPGTCRAGSGLRAFAIAVNFFENTVYMNLSQVAADVT